ncbi:lipopolysaccharide biosynthesis protein [Dellaglioa carnosa]|uniref:Oligosaccharide flippase family protein n=1 Tax=Dellaglioa carnosa TaxID=2995136 RepID=A0ABT4JMM0_9LACO|nr:oligosaccharide flippase family protein [Dellaglioa carnosa]MCZ2491594.1 oligosaccharide flippase family protein [Dellaglioa carnosa]MCZ2494671.1 oligosaccharide flippase family protein [Dellaglioa carnosa]MDK1731534.1 oligosaccharide flippase family protein [Dellaglioa carnosa]
MNREKKLISNTIVFGIGNIGSKVIMFLIVPIYTYYMSTSEYGSADLLNTIVMLLTPLLSLSVYDAVLRWVLDKKETIEDIFNTGLTIVIISGMVSMIISIVTYVVYPNVKIILLCTLIICQIFNTFFSQFLKGIEKNIIFAINGIIQSVGTIIFALVFLNQNMNHIDAFFLSLICSSSISIAYMFIFGELYKYYKLNKFNKKLMTDMLIYSLPLIPNQLMWWVMNVSDRYIVIYYLGYSVNGIYAVATKIPAVLNILSSVFLQSWQISAIEENNSADRTKYFSSIFNNMNRILTIGVSGILIFIRPFSKVIFGAAYQDVWKFVPLLLVALLFSNFSMFIGMSYLASMKTWGIFRTSILGAVINILLNIILIPLIGLNGAALSTAVSFFIIWVIRIKETKSFVKIKIDWMYFVSITLILIVQIVSLFITSKIILLMIPFIFVIFINRKFLIESYKFLLGGN